MVIELIPPLAADETKLKAAQEVSENLEVRFILISAHPFD